MVNQLSGFDSLSLIPEYFYSFLANESHPSMTTMTKSGSLASERCLVSLDSPMIHKDVSGSQPGTFLLLKANRVLLG